MSSVTFCCHAQREIVRFLIWHVQIEVHPRFQQTALRAFCKQHSIAVVAYASLGCGNLLDDETVCSIAEDIGKTPAQVRSSTFGPHTQIYALPQSAQ